MSPIRPEMKARYPHDWSLRSRFVRVVRARNRCEWCGAANGQPHPVTGSLVILTTAHVFDHRPEAAGLLNLAALCQKCHNGHDMKQRLAGIRARGESGQGLLFDPEAVLQPHNSRRAMPLQKLSTTLEFGRFGLKIIR